jgi:lipoprotein NlpD
MKKIRLVVLVMSAGLIAACSTPRNPAPIVDNAPSVTSAEVVKPAASGPSVAARASARNPFYIVKKGDTLYRIALDLGQNYRDIIAWNNLSNPNDIKVDQALRVLPPEAGPGSGAAQTASVAAASAVEVRALPAASVASTAVAPNKIAPRGDKRPYSEAAMAELQKPDAVATNVVALSSPAAKADVPKIVEVKAVEKPAQAATTAEDENVSWMWPADGKIVASFDESKKGIDIAGKNGQQVVAAGSGKVMYAGSGIRGYGNLVIVKHTSTMLSAYAHNKTILVKEGQIVNKGQQIAEMGSSDADAVKLHFEIRQQGKPVDPSKFLPNR